ncbi:hypothetical protein VNO77_30830 [Canavalia gladiata]|uniref:Uncharacterized protein n=1 Tax=Canavalia gladiata TaxID=3824 RepID=A0AAN9KR67_CANGL
MRRTAGFTTIDSLIDHEGMKYSRSIARLNDSAWINSSQGLTLIKVQVSHAAWKDGIRSKCLGDLMTPPYPNHFMHPSSHAKLQEFRTWVNTRCSYAKAHGLLRYHEGLEFRYAAVLTLSTLGIHFLYTVGRLDDSNDPSTTMPLGSVVLQPRNVLGGVPSSFSDKSPFSLGVFFPLSKPPEMSSFSSPKKSSSPTKRQEPRKKKEVREVVPSPPLERKFQLKKS